MTDAAVETGQVLSASEVCEQAGLTYRNLDYWVRSGFIDFDVEHVGEPTPGSGYPRRFTLAEAQRFVVLARLVRAGFRVSSAAGVVRRMEAGGFEPVDLGEGVQVSVDRSTS